MKQKVTQKRGNFCFSSRQSERVARAEHFVSVGEARTESEESGGPY